MRTARLFIRAAALAIGLGVAGLAAMIAFGTAAPPKPLASINDPFRQVDFSGLPAIAFATARDGTKLAYRAYPAGSEKVVLLIHGSSASGASMHVLAGALQAAGITVFVPDMRGHGESGRRGDIDHVGQMDDDIADLMAVFRPLFPAAQFSLVGFSSGGGFTLRIAGGPYGALFDRYVLISPFLRHDAPLNRPGGAWVAPFIPRIIGLAILDRFGIHRFEGLPVIAFALAPEAKKFLTASYSYRLNKNFKPHDDYLGNVHRAPRPIALVAGQADELFYTDRYAGILQAARPDLGVTLVPGEGHIGMILDPAGVQAVARLVSS
jgi:pimeloyl-ACP methyl ester carboxylesterase